MYNFSKFFITLFLLGKIKIASGTVGSIFSFAIIFLFYIFLSKIIFFIIFLLILFLSFILINSYQKKEGKKDHSEIIIDEFLGVYTIFFFKDYFIYIDTFFFILISFIFFRIFDILKPFPINLIDRRFKNAFGIIIDDILAGIYSILLLFIIYEIF